MTYSIKEELEDIPTVVDVKETEGMYDIVLVMKSDSVEEIKQTIVNKIRLIDGIRSSLTLFEVNNSDSL